MVAVRVLSWALAIALLGAVIATDPEPFPRYPTVALASAAVGPTMTYVANGDAASVIWGDTATYGSVWVIRTGTIQAPTTSLEIDFLRFDPCCTELIGTGQIANDDFAGSGTSKLSLTTNTCGNPLFSTGDATCGLIAIRWQKDGTGMFHSAGAYQQNAGSFTFALNGEQTGSFASASGSLFGLTMGGPNSYVLGEVLKMHNTWVEITTGR